MRNNSKVAKAKNKAKASVSEVRTNLKEAAKLAAELRRKSNWEALGFASFDQMMACQGIRNRIYLLRDALNNSPARPANSGQEPEKNSGGSSAGTVR